MDEPSNTPAPTPTPRPRFVQQTYSMGDPSFPILKALATADALEDAEILRKLVLPPNG